VADPLADAQRGQYDQSEHRNVDFARTHPNALVLQAKAAGPAVLLLNDRFDPNWKVSVDGNPAKMLRCNYLMRGVYLQAGRIPLSFRFEPPVNSLYVSLAAVLVAVVLLGVLSWWRIVPVSPTSVVSQNSVEPLAGHSARGQAQSKNANALSHAPETRSVLGLRLSSGAMARKGPRNSETPTLAPAVDGVAQASPPAGCGGVPTRQVPNNGRAARRRGGPRHTFVTGRA